ncbi:T-cell surface glycoprotein CD4 isoform X2 [Etheostoma spectabile]|uniref:T-cell surface glycoprotein CD4 isoform X2 n=1 Tax=Etheostoma spectabile TaxID=54343 RepID=UPI0013AF4AA8|nr:T-cell surface glycoprotein CD4-like isoform X2 [Etheostoma spectabile]
MKTIVWFGFVLGALSAAGEVILRKPGQKATFKCSVDTYTLSLEWNRGNDLIIRVNGKTGFTVRDPKYKDNLKLRGTSLEISGVTEEDAGKFICTADGRRKENTLLVVSVSASPSSELQLGSEAMLQCQVKGLHPPNSPVQWKRPNGGPNSESQTVQLKSVAHSDEGNWQCTFSYEGGEYSESLEVKVQDPVPKTTAPSPSTSSKDASFNPPPSTDVVLLGLSWWMWVAVGGGCLVVILLMVFVIVLCKRIKRRKRKFHHKRNGRQPLNPKTYCQCDRPAAAAKPQQGRRKEKPSALPLQPLLA